MKLCEVKSTLYIERRTLNGTVTNAPVWVYKSKPIWRNNLQRYKVKRYYSLPITKENIKEIIANDDTDKFAEKNINVSVMGILPILEKMFPQLQNAILLTDKYAVIGKICQDEDIFMYYDRREFTLYKGIAFVLLEDLKEITKLDKRDITKKAIFDKKENDKKLIDGFFESSIKAICEKYNLTYNPESMNIYFSDMQTMLNMFKEKIEETIIKDLKEIGIAAQLSKIRSTKRTFDRYDFILKASVDDIK